MSESAGTVALAVLGFIGFAGLLAGLKIAHRWIQRSRAKMVRASIALFGADAVHDRVTGDVIQEAVPGAAMRLVSIERWQGDATIALQTIAAAQAELVVIHRRLDDADSARLLLAQQLNDHVEEELAARASRADADLKMWEAITAVAHAEPSTYETRLSS